MGGVIITQAASSCPERVAALIYVTAFMPANGQSLLELTQLPEGQDDQIQANIVIEGEPPVATLSAEAAIEAIYNNCPPEQARAAVARHRPRRSRRSRPPSPSTTSCWRRSPGRTSSRRGDQSIPPALQRRMIAEHPCRMVIELDTDHMPQLSAPDGLAGALLELAGA